MYNLFVSHAWSRDDHYRKVIEWLESSSIVYRNYSVPEHDPLDAMSPIRLKAALTRQINPASCVIIIAGMYVAHSGWIDYEIDEAVRMQKQLLGSSHGDNKESR